ncbi:MAG: phage portal protein [Patescibacteria group bacterium]|jgi:HK97 family phage portal protein|nr:phage portal protein [Patescibacteria group bacterium]
MNLVKRFYNQIIGKQAVPYSFFVNSGIMSSVVTKTDALDFYKSWVYACVSRRSMGLAQIEFKLYRLKKNGEVEEIIEHELLELLYRINPEMTKYNFIQLSVVYRDLLGASPWILSKTNKTDKTPSNIYIARPEYFKVKKDDNGNILGYTYEIGSYKKEFEKEEVLFLKNYNPKNPDKGIGIIEAVRMTAQNDDYILQSNSNLLKNDARPSGFLEMEGNADAKMIKRLKKEFRKKYQGYENSHNVQLLEGGIKFKPVTIPPKDLDFIESRKMNRDEILSIFGVPKPVLGVFEDVNRASAIAAEYVFNKWTLEPLATEMIEQINEFLVPMFGKDLWLGFEHLAKEDEEMDLKKKEASWNKWMTTNEIRESEGFEPINGGDYIYMPLSSMPIIGGKETKTIKIKALRSGGVNLKLQKKIKRRILNRDVKLRKLGEKASNKMANSLINKKGIVLKIVEKKTLSDEQKERFYKIRMDNEKRMEKIWKKKFIEFFEDQKERFIKSIEDNYQKDVLTKHGINMTYELETVISVIDPLIYETVMAGVAGASELIGENMVIDMEFIKEWLGKVSRESGRIITDTTINDFEKEMKEGVDDGESLEKLRLRVEKVFDFAKDYRAEMIARTETARGVVEAHRKTYEHYGFTSAEWLLSPDACEVCIGQSGKEWTIKSIEGEIPVHPNCKCDFTPV